MLFAWQPNFSMADFSFSSEILSVLKVYADYCPTKVASGGAIKKERLINYCLFYS